MVTRILGAGFLVLLSFSASVFAEDKSWSDVAELSYVTASGNTEVSTISAKNLLKYKFSDQFSGSWDVSALYAENDGVKSAERYQSDVRADYSFTARVYVYGLGGWLRDRPAGIDRRIAGGVGTGYRVFLGPVHTLLGEVGVGRVTENYLKDPANPLAKRSDTHVTSRGFLEYGYAFSEKSRASLSGEYVQNVDDKLDWGVNGKAALVSALNSFLSMKASYEVKYDNEPPSSKKKRDSTVTVALVVNF